MWNWNNWNRFRQQVTEWVTHLEACRKTDEMRINFLGVRIEQMSQEADDLKTAFEAYKADVNAQVGALVAKVNQLQTQITTAPNDIAAMNSLTAEINAAKVALDATTAPPAPAPAPTPESAPDPAPAPADQSN